MKVKLLKKIRSRFTIIFKNCSVVYLLDNKTKREVNWNTKVSLTSLTPNALSRVLYYCISVVIDGENGFGITTNKMFINKAYKLKVLDEQKQYKKLVKKYL